MNSEKKKPRQRNRARNKCNRFAEDLNQNDNNRDDVDQRTESLNCSDISNNINNENNNNLNSNNNADACKASNLVIENNKTSQCTGDELIAQGLYEKSQSMRLMQNLLQGTFLKNQKSENSTFPQNAKDKTNCQLNLKALSTNTSKKLIGSQAPKTEVDKIKRNPESLTENSPVNLFEGLQAGNLPNLEETLLGNLRKLLEQKPISDVESSDEDDEYLEYVYKPRQYFIVSLCNFCKADLCKRDMVPCTRCQMTYYCSEEHRKHDKEHRQICYGIQQLIGSIGQPIFYKCGVFDAEQFRSYRIVTIKKLEEIINRNLTAMEQEILLFPRICNEEKCREYRFDRLIDCQHCGQVAYCRDKETHFSEKQHAKWCEPFKLFKELVIFQEKFGKLDPSIPTKTLKELPIGCSNTRQILQKLSFDMRDPCEYAALTQISTAPLTAWYALKLCNQLNNTSDKLTVHLIGAETDFEVYLLHKWEIFFLHLTPTIKELHVVFIGPELNPRNLAFDKLKKTKCCRLCRKGNRSVSYHFENQIYHEYSASDHFMKPDLICFFNAGLYRSTGYNFEDTWPETILSAANCKCPVVVTSYTAYEAPLDMARFVQECNRRFNIILPPTRNPFSSEKPERNFISDNEAPLMFKNYYCFVIE